MDVLVRRPYDALKLSDTNRNFKPYSPALGLKYDSIGKKVVAEILHDVYKVESISENSGEADKSFKDGFWDLVAIRDQKTLYFEAEVKDAKFWNGSSLYPFKYNTIHIPARKLKNKSDVFCLVSSNEDLSFWVKRKDIEKSGKVVYKHTEKDGKTLTDNEPFIEIGLNHGQFYEKIDERWQKWTGGQRPLA